MNATREPGDGDRREPVASDGRREPIGLPWSNWAGNQRAIAASVSRPDHRDGIVEAVRAAAARGTSIKVVGSGHSFAAVAATFGVRLELDGGGRIAVDREGGLVTVPAGARLSRLTAVLAEHGLALPGVGQHGLTMPFLGFAEAPTVGGALATGAHGTAGGAGGLAASVVALELVTAAGEVLRCSATEHAEIFAAAAVGLGALGVVTEVQLRCVPASTLLVDEHPADFEETLASAGEHVAGNDHVWYSWYPYTDTVRVRLGNRVPADDRQLPGWHRWRDDVLLAGTGYRLACRLARRWPRLAAATSRYAARYPGARSHTAPWYAAFADRRRVRYVAMEYAVPRAAMPELLASVRSIVDHLPTPVFLPVDVRFTAGDDAWLSPAYRRDTAYLAVRQYQGMPYEEYFLRIEALASALGGRPHWGMVHWRDAASLATAYPRFGDFLAVRNRLDPDRLFSNTYLERVLGP